MRHGELISDAENDKIPALDFCYSEVLGIRDCTVMDAYPTSVEGSMYFYQGPENGNHVCRDCHSGYRYYARTPLDIPAPTNPVVQHAKAEPSNIANNGATSPVLLSAFVVDPNEDLSSVTIDLSALGGLADQPMYDDGTNGDVTPGDEIYSYLLSSTSSSADNYTLTITATDALANPGTGQALVTVHDEPGVYIVDNIDAAFTVSDWPYWSDPPLEYFGTNYQYLTASGTGDNTATWQVPSYMPAGTYKVYARWVSYSNRGIVNYTINDSSGPIVAGPFDQTQDSGIWVDLGMGTQTFTFNAGSGSVVLKDDTTGVIIADAIKWEPVP